MTQTYILKPVILEPYTEIQQNSQSFRQDEFKSKSAERTIVREHRLNSKNSPVSSFVNDAVPLKESWLFNNKKALIQLNNGIKDSAKGQVKFIETDIVIARSEATRQSRKIIKNSVNQNF